MQRSIRFPDDLNAALEERAQEEDRSFSSVVIRACKAALAGDSSTPSRPVSRAEQFRAATQKGKKA